MQQRPSGLIDPTFRKILQVSSINEYLTRADTFSPNPNPLPADVIYANKVAEKVKSLLTTIEATKEVATVSVPVTAAYDREAEIALLAEMASA